MGNMKFTGQYTDVYTEGPAGPEGEETAQHGANPDFEEEPSSSSSSIARAPPQPEPTEQADLDEELIPEVQPESRREFARKAQEEREARKKPRVVETEETTTTQPAIEEASLGKRPANEAEIRSRRLRQKTPFGPRMVTSETIEEIQHSLMSMMSQETTIEEEQPILTIDFPDISSDKNWKDVIGRPECYMTTNLKKKRVEINERRATPVERELIQKGKCIEIQEFLQEKVVKAATDQELKTLKPGDIMKMRFVLTWKVDPASPQGEKAKARLVVLGFQDPFLGK